MKYVKLFEEYLKVNPKICVLYSQEGVNFGSKSLWLNFFREQFNYECTSINVKDLSFNKILKFDLLIIPGGDSAEIIENFSDTGAEDIKRYVKEGGKVLGVCAGAVILSQSWDWCLGIIPVEFNRNKHSVLPTEKVLLDFSFSKEGKKVFLPEEDKINLCYIKGPIFKRNSDVEELMFFAEDLELSDTSNYGKGYLASAMNKYGKGFAMLISPHIERTDGKGYLLKNAINYILNK